MRKLLFLILPVLLLIIHSSNSHGQEYGLGFAGQPNSKDRRTQLDLNPDQYFSFSGEFELSFQMRIRVELPMTFGYVFRIVDMNNNNVDLIFNGPKSHSLQLVCNNKLTGISVPYTDSSIYKEWKEIRVKFNLREQTVRFITPETRLVESDVPVTGKVKIFFGRNQFDPVQTTDVPLMDIRDIRIFQKNKPLYHFPLDEISGNKAHDALSQKTALVQNPIWILPDYHDWALHFSTILNGFATVCFDHQKEKVYMVGDAQMKIYSIKKDSIQTLDYVSRFTGLTTGSQVIFDTINERLVCYNLRARAVYYFDFSELQWQEISDGPDNQDRFWFHNKYFSGSDSALYVFGGYSQHRYSNMVLKYDFSQQKWDTIPTSGDAFHPRMHAALGAMGDTVYILGGFGSAAGDQAVNPGHYNDLLAFSLKEKRFEKKYDFVAPNGDIDFAHSMIFDKEDESFYVLASSIYQYESYLQILKGSLTNPELQSMGNKIPYLFHNENSYSDLFFSKSTQQIIAVTSLADSEKHETEFKVYSIAYPPVPSVAEQLGKSGPKTIWIVLILLLAVSLLFLVSRWIYLKSKRTTEKATVTKRSGTDQHKAEIVSSASVKRKKAANSILFFGGFQVINRSGEDITRKFSPLVKELFLLIFLYSVKDKGISVARLTELLWFPMDAKSAKNNRAVNIAKLKHLLSEVDSCDLTRKTEYWQILFDDSKVYSDYYVCHNLTTDRETISRNDLEKLLRITKAGSLLGNVGYEWLDEFKLESSNQITDVLINFLEKEESSVEPELMVRIADAILIFDIMHEEAISIKCRALTALGKHSLAKEIFNKFSRDYQSLYDEPYDKSFTDLIKNN